jgi:uncharacterized protein
MQLTVSAAASQVNRPLDELTESQPTSHLPVTTLTVRLTFLHSGCEMLRDYRKAIVEYIREEAQPPDKFSHQPRLYALAHRLGQESGQPFDDDVLYAAAWMHDLGVFAGHRPSDLNELAQWDNVAYAIQQTPAILARFGFPTTKIPAVLEAIRAHLPSAEPTTNEGVLLRDADILEQLGAVGIARMISKVGRDTRYPTHQHAVRVLDRARRELPSKLKLALARDWAGPRITLMEDFIREWTETTRE